MQPGAAQAAKGAGGLEVPAAHRHPTQSQNAVNQMQAIRAQLHTRKVETAARRGLKSVEKITHDRRLQTGRLDRRAVSRIALGAPDVMARRTTTPGLRTAVALMLDASGSMSSSVTLGDVTAPRFMASLAVLSVLAPAMRRAGAEVAVYGFTATGGFVTSTGKDPHGGLVGVMSGASVFPLLGWHERAPTEALVQRWSTLHAPGGTPMAREAEYVTRALLSRRTERRAAVWLCDGEANDPDQAARVIASANRRGVEHAGIGIGGDITPSSLEALFGPDRWRHVPDDLGQLPDAIEAVLLGGGK